MMNNILGNSHHHQTRLRLQSEKASVLPGEVPVLTHQGDLRAISAAVENLLKYTGFQGRARRNCFDYRLERNDVYLQNLPASFDGYTILHLSDLHADGLVDEGDGIVRIVETVPCDLAVVTGDFCFEEAGAQYETCLDALAPIIRSISAQDGIFGILGNHDLLEMVPVLERMGMQMLLNEMVQLKRATEEIALVGVDDPHFYKCHDLQKALSSVDPDQFVIFLSHSPEIAQEAALYDVDLFLCGHTHGGQICLPGGVAMFANSACSRRYVSGSWKCGAMQGYTSRGSGFSVVAARFFCPPEITLHTLHVGSQSGKLCKIVEEYSSGFSCVTGHTVFA